MGSNYQKREIDQFHKEIKDKLDTIESQVRLTNGRVKKLELWKAYVAGALAILTLLVVPIALSLVMKVL